MAKVLCDAPSPSGSAGVETEVAGPAPGPWSVGETPYDHYVFGTDGFEVASAPSAVAIHRDYYANKCGDGCWAATGWAYRDVEVGEPAANARLIAAAPDGLKLAKLIARLAHTEELSTHTEVSFEHHEAALILALAETIIAKAEGK